MSLSEPQIDGDKRLSLKHDRLSLKRDRLSYMKHGCHLSWHPNSKDQNYSLSVVKIVNKVRYNRWMCKHMETVELYWHSNLPACLCETDCWVCVKQPMVLLFCDIHVNIGTTLNLLQWLNVNCWILSCTMQRHHWHCWLISYAKVGNWALGNRQLSTKVVCKSHNNNQLGSR